jgi:hypothetical protein
MALRAVIKEGLQRRRFLSRVECYISNTNERAGAIAMW